MRITKIEKNGREYFQLDLNVGTRRVRRFFSDLDSANAEAKKQQKELAKFGHVVAAMPEQERQEMLSLWMKVKASGIKADDLLEAARGVSDTSPTVPEAVTACIKAKKEAGVSARYLKQLKHTLGSMVKTFAASRVGSLAPDTITNWATRGGELSRWTARSRLTDCITLYSFCERQGWITHQRNPCRKLERRTPPNPEPGILRVKACAKLMRGAHRRDPGLCCWLALSLFCGIRPAEMQKLKPQNLLLDQKLVVISNEVAKTRQRRLVHIPENAMEWIAVSGAIVAPTNLKRRFDRLRKQLGLYRDWPHDALRHSAATYHVAMHQNAPMTALEMGHSVPVLMTHYRALVTKEQAEAFYKIRPGI